MSHQDDQLLIGYGLDYVHYLKGVGAVQISRRFVRYDYGRILDDGAGYAHSLPLSSGKHVGIALSVPVHANQVESILHLLLYLFFISDPYHPEHHGHVVKNRHAVDQVIVLENISDVEISDLVHPAGRAAGDLLSVYEYLSLVYLVKPADDVEERGLSAARRTQKSHQSLFTEFQRGIVYDVDLV